MSDDRSLSRRAFIGNGVLAILAWMGFSRRAYAGCDLTTDDVLGPYYLTGSPSRTVIASADEAGTRLFLTGRIIGTDCVTPLAGTIVDVWQASNAGCYSRVQPCPDEDPWNLRGQTLTDAGGQYQLETILPGYYAGRCRHIHFRFVPSEGEVLVTQLYFEGDPRIHSDPFASRPEAANRIIPLTVQADGLHGAFDLVLDAAATDIADEGYDPEITYLHPGFPNPFRESATIRFSLAQPGPVELSIYNARGRRVRRLLSESVPVGYHTVVWDGQGDSRETVPSGIYFCRLTASGRTYASRLARVD